MSRALLRDSTIYGLGTLLTQSLGLVLLPIYTRHFSVAEYGTLSLLNATLQIVSFITVLGVSSAAMRLYFDRPGDEDWRRTVYGNATVMLLCFPAAVMVVLGPVVWLLNTRLVASVPFSPLVLMVLAIGLFSPLIKLVTGFMRVRRMPRAFVLFNLAFFLVQTGTIIVSVVGLGLGLFGQVAAQLATNALFAGVALVALLRIARPALQADLTRRMLAFGVPLVPFFVFTWINGSAGRFFLERFGDLGQVGIFALAAQFAGVMQLAAVAFDNAMMPHFLARAGQPGGARELGLVINRYLGFLGLMGLAIVAGATPVIAIMAATPFHEAARWVAPLTLAAWLAVANQPFVWSLNHAKRTGLLSGIVAGSCAALVLLLGLLVGGLGAGIAGVVGAMLAANLLTLAGGWLLARRHLAIEPRAARLAGIVATLLAAGAALAWLAAPEPEPARLAAQAAILAAAAALIARLAAD